MFLGELPFPRAASNGGSCSSTELYEAAAGSCSSFCRCGGAEAVDQHGSYLVLTWFWRV
jgi:hypothetical protein